MVQLKHVGQNTCKGRPGCLATPFLAQDIGILHDRAPPPVLKFNEYGDFAGLVNNSPHGVEYMDVPYPTALHLFEAHKFLDHMPDLAERIRLCERVDWVTVLSGQLAGYTRGDWGNIGLSTVSKSSHFPFPLCRDSMVCSFELDAD